MDPEIGNTSGDGYDHITSLSLSLLVHHVFILASVKRQLFSLGHLGHGTNLRRNTADAKRGSNAMDCHRLSWPSALSHLHLKTELKQVRNLFVHVILTKIHYRFIKFVLFVTWLHQFFTFQSKTSQFHQ